MEPPLSDRQRLRSALRPPERQPFIPERYPGGTRASSPGKHRLPDDALSQRLQANRALLAAATPHLQWVSALLADVRHVVSLTDADGILVRSMGNWPEQEALGLLPGYDWSEDAEDASAAGTALVRDQPVALAIDRPARSRACAAVPIHGTDGQVIGAIEISTPTDQPDPGRLALAAQAAQATEQSLTASATIFQADSVRLLMLTAGFAAHELANPLAALKTMIDLLARAQLQGEAADMIAAAERNAGRLLEVVEELRILGGSYDRHLRRTDLQALLQRALKAAGLVGRVDIDSRLPPDRQMIDCNPALLCRALDNLLRNARDAVAKTGGTIGVRLLAAEDGVRIVVWDTGAGVPAERRHSLLQEPFSTKLGGGGLGLLLVRVIVEQVHGGRFSYYPNSPCGSRFEIRLPRSYQTSESLPAA